MAFWLLYGGGCCRGVTVMRGSTVLASSGNVSYYSTSKKKSYRLRKGGHIYRDGIKRKGDKIGMEYEARHCEHADTSRDNRTNVTWRFISPRQQYRVCAIVSGSVSMLTMSSYLCFIFHPYLVSFPFYAIPICPPIRNP